ncbi:catalytic/ pyridoxal phosphate binding protein [Corchorus olitorius]|uniref:Catalytic/ pyridoxal phosphate binding protein n=1 Tax=Corchorus olitorius TaxID=93759 RepID=A0A1R3KT95_9ROSI|nr:catalytic/ pyridoxal phosphate binding protein [Corchorus olitorius]
MSEKCRLARLHPLVADLGLVSPKPPLRLSNEPKPNQNQCPRPISITHRRIKRIPRKKAKMDANQGNKEELNEDKA